MTGVGIFGLLLGLAASWWAFVEPTRVRVAVFAAAYVMHVAAALFYYQMVQGGGADAALYYYDEAGMYGQPFALNTVFVVYVVQVPKSIFGGTYLDYFLVFQAVGFFGLAALMRTFEEIHLEVGVPQPIYTYLLLFMPSLHYWTSAIGKDSLFFFGICLTLWAAMRYKRRLIAFVIGLGFMLMIRPHVAVVAGAAFALSVLLDRNTRLALKLPLFALSAAGTAYAIVSVWSTFQIDVTNVDAYTDLLSGREALLETEAAGRTAVTGSYPVRVVSLLFRPFFFDSGGALGLIVSFENLLLVLIVGLMLFHLRTTASLARRVPFVRYALVSSLVITLVLALGYYNVGLGIRQKATMILPGILVVAVALHALLRARRTPPQETQLVLSQPSFG